MLQITEACGVLIKYILNKFEKSTNSETKLLLPALKSLCEGKSQDQDFDQIVLSSILRNAKYPEHKANVTGNEIFYLLKNKIDNIDIFFKLKNIEKK